MRHIIFIILILCFLTIPPCVQGGPGQDGGGDSESWYNETWGHSVRQFAVGIDYALGNSIRFYENPEAGWFDSPIPPAQMPEGGTFGYPMSTGYFYLAQSDRQRERFEEEYDYDDGFDRDYGKPSPRGRGGDVLVVLANLTPQKRPVYTVIRYNCQFDKTPIWYNTMRCPLSHRIATHCPV